MQSDMSALSRYMEAISSSGYRREQDSSFQSRLTYGVQSTDQSRRASRSSHGGRENIKLIPMKYKDLMEVLQTNPQYKDKSPITIKMKESEIDKIIEKQHYRNSGNSVLPQQSLKHSSQLSPMTKDPVGRDYTFETPSFEPEYTSFNEQTSRSDYQHRSDNKTTKPPLGENQAQVYAMTGIQAYPMIGASGGAFVNGKNKAPRKKSKRKIKRARSRSRRPRSRSRQGIRPKSRDRSRRRQSPKNRKLIDVRSSRRRPRTRSTVIVRRKRRPVSSRRAVSSRRSVRLLDGGRYCTPYPLCDYDCTPYTTYGRLSRPLIGQNTAGMTCNCTMCEEKLQFIQPGVCSQRKDMWTNEYAIIPKPQVNLIDPCKELDPSIYPRADRPCIRDGRGNPLTDCIGRPLRDPVGKRFLNFNANGSVMDTNFRGNFFTGQPPLCVKCPLPGRSCAPDTTHNWWMSCGYPVKANMAPFFNNVVAAENAKRRC